MWRNGATLRNRRLAPPARVEHNRRARPKQIMSHPAQSPSEPQATEAPLRVVFNSPQSGYMSVGLSAGAREFSTVVACRPYDSLSDLIDALTAFLGGDEHTRVVRWNCEPDEIDFRFSPEDAGRLRLEVCHYATNARAAETCRTVISVSNTRREIGGAFLHALTELERDKEVDVFESNWRREFPALRLRALDEAFGALAGGE